MSNKQHEHAQLQEQLPIEVRPAQNAKDLHHATLIRASAYARHLPEFAAQLHMLEAADTERGTVVLVASAKADGHPVGTLRLQSNRYAPLPVERSQALPDWLRSGHLVEATRLAVEASELGALARNALFKACFLYCAAARADWLVAAARKPLDRLYESLLFRDVFPGVPDIRMQHVGNLPHRVMALNVSQANELWAKQGHPLYRFMTGVEHPDIAVVDTSIAALVCAN